MANKRDLWDEYESIFGNQLQDRVSATTKSRVFDPKLATMVLERSYRVMSQLPTGKVRAMSKNDEMTEKLMNLVLEKYILPNATAQYDFLTKCRMVDTYSNIYGNFFAFVDWDVKKNGYVGPDLWLLNIRDVFPQVGAVSPEDSDYIIIRTWQSLDWFESLKPTMGYKNLSRIITSLKDKTGDKETRDTNSRTAREDDQFTGTSEAHKKGYFEVLHMYERDRWIDYVVDAGDNGVLRDFDNPQENGELPVICKYSIPMLDDFMGMGDFERGKSMQYALNSLWNLYLDAVKISIFPPTLVNKDNIADNNSIKFGPAAKWLVRGQIGNAAQVLNMTPQGINSFNNTYQVVNASLLNMFGTTDTATTSQTDPAFGRTPQALQMQAQREGARDSADRFYMEQFLKKVINRMCNLVTKKQSTALSIRLFKTEIDELEAEYPDTEEMIDQDTGKISIKKKLFGDTMFDYEMVSGSTYAVDQIKQQQSLQAILEIFMRNPALGQILQQTEGKEFKVGELITRIMANSGIQDWDKILVDMNKGTNLQNVMQAHAQQLAGALTALTGNVNQIPPEQMGQPPMQQQPMPGLPNEQNQTGY